MSGPIVPTAPGGAKTPAPSGQIVQIVSLPDGLKNNARAIRIEGEVIQQNKDGSVRVRTPEGDIDINVRGKQPQPGTKIEVDIPAGSPPRQATIRPAPVPPPALPLPQTPTTSTPAPPPPLPQAPVTSPPSSQPPVTTTQDQAPDAPDIYYHPQSSTNAPATTKPATPPPAPLPPLEPGQEVKLVPLPKTDAPMPDTPEQPMTVTKVAAQANIIAQKSEGNLITTLLQAVKSVLPQLVTPQTNTAPAPIIGKTPMPMVTTQPALPMPANISMQPLVLPAKIVSLVLPSGQILTAPTPTPATPAPITASTPQITVALPTAPLITVTVTEVTPQQQPIIPIPLNDKGAVQNFVLQSPPASVPIGTQVILQPLPMQGITTPTQIPTAPQQTIATTQTPNVQIAPPAMMLPPAWRGFLPLMQPASLWPVMDEMFQTFYQATPQAAQILGRIIPSPANGANFGPAVLLFAAALKSGELQAWMGDKKLEMLQKLGKDSILSRLSGERAALSGNADAPATDWKSFPVPMLWQNEISKIMLHVRQEAQDNDKENKDGTTRFVLDLSLTRMGDVQFDGTVNGKRLDIIVRTQIPVSVPMQEAMKVAYANALEGSDIYGELGFQGDMKQWVNVIKREDNIQASV